jgi:hypothetical protein
MPTRIVTRNLLYSAHRAMSEDARQSNEITCSNIRDLCSLIDLAALSDTVDTFVGIDRCGMKEKAAAIAKDTGLTISFCPHQTERAAVIQAARMDILGRMIAKNTFVDLEQIDERLGNALDEDAGSFPDDYDDFEAGRKMSTMTLGTERSNQFAYWQRTFLYGGLSRIRQAPLVLDSARLYAARTTGLELDMFRRKLLEAVELIYQKKLSKYREDTSLSISPFAATVLIRTGNDPHKIGAEIQHLRDELSEARTALQGYDAQTMQAIPAGEIQRLFPFDRTDESLTEVKARFQLELKELYDSGKGWRQFVSYRFYHLVPLAKFLRSSVILMSHLVAPELSWFKAFRDAWDTFSLSSEVSAQNDSFVEIHDRFAQDLREFGTKIKLEILFGKIKSDPLDGLGM